MEIVALPKNGIRIKGKNAHLSFNSPDKTAPYNGLILFDGKMNPAETGLPYMVIQGPGDYEVSGVKISGMKGSDSTVYSLIIDGIDILIGKISNVEKIQQKLQEYNIAVLLVDEVVDASFATGLAANAVLFYGEKASETVKNLSKETVKELPKYQITKDKLPTEVDTVLLTS